MSTTKKTLLGIGGVMLFVALCVGGWQLRWWTAEHAANNQYRVNTSSQMYQAGLVSQLRDTVHAYTVSVDPAQREHIRFSFCARYVDLDPAPTDLRNAHDIIIAC